MMTSEWRKNELRKVTERKSNWENQTEKMERTQDKIRRNNYAGKEVCTPEPVCNDIDSVCVDCAVLSYLCVEHELVKTKRCKEGGSKLSLNLKQIF